MSDTLERDYAHYQKIEAVIHYIDKHFKEKPSLETLASHIGMSQYHFLRTFKEYVGVTPIQFLQAVTLEQAKKTLQNTPSLLDTSLEMGFSSSSRLHDLFVNFTGLTPKEYKDLGKDLQITYGYGLTPFGKALIAWTGRGVCFLAFGEEEKVLSEALEKSWGKADLSENRDAAQSYLEKIFLDKKKVDLCVKGTNFQINVWKALLNIPYASVTTYKDIAQVVEKPKAVRAVATAIGANDLAYLIPCHRVIAKSGAMSGYRWGVDRKKILLAVEAMKVSDAHS